MATWALNTILFKKYNSPIFSKAVLFFGLIIWLLAVGSGLAILYDYVNAPANVLAPLAFWPATSHVMFTKDHPNLVMAVHPHCVCTKASMNELARLMTVMPGQLSVHILFQKPSSFPKNWAKSSIWEQASEIPGVDLVEDIDGAEAKLFRATVSGQVFLYNEKGALIFSGGITGARGHEGDNKGRSAIERWLKYRQVTGTESFVFGCSLFTQQEPIVHNNKK